MIRYILVLIVLFILEILDHFSYFAQPSRPIEYYDNNIDKVTSAFDIINYIDKLFVSLLLVVYLKITNTVIDREKKEFYLLTENESESSMSKPETKNKNMYSDNSFNRRSPFDSTMNYDNEINNAEVLEIDLKNQENSNKKLANNNNDTDNSGLYTNIYNNNYTKANVCYLFIFKFIFVVFIYLIRK